MYIIKIGNESPVEEYANHTGLIWKLAFKYNALVVFAEHRYEGKSIPHNLTNSNCFSYSSSAQALEDYNSLLTSVFNPDHKRAVIVFGGSYGGMLSSWMRMKYPTSVAGAIAASAPIWATPKTFPPLDGAYVAVSRALVSGIDLSEGNDVEYNCFDNLLASWTIIKELGKSDMGRDILTKAFDTCHPIQNVNDTLELLEWAKSPWFLLAEADYPFPSSYITNALYHIPVDLPPWPMRLACDAVSNDYGIHINGNKTDVRYTIGSITSLWELQVDWDKVSFYGNEEDLLADHAIQDLLGNVKDAVGIWFNATKDVTCYDITSIPDSSSSTTSLSFSSATNPFKGATKIRKIEEEQEDETCSTLFSKNEGCWYSLCCNEQLNLVMMQAMGIGHDFFWPPSHPRNTTYDEILSSYQQSLDLSCSDPTGIKGYPSNQNFDIYSTWVDDYYGGLRISKNSNIIFSNGLHDPWSAGGVLNDIQFPMDYAIPYNGPIMMNLTEDGSMISLIIDHGAHHLDLMFDSDEDFDTLKEVRRIEDMHIGHWIEEWESQDYCIDKSCRNR